MIALKGFTSKALYACPVCSETIDSGKTLMTIDLDELLDESSIVDWALCEEHLNKIAEGYKYLVEVDDDFIRTGAYLELEPGTYEKIFNNTCEGVALCTETIMNKLSTDRS